MSKKYRPEGKYQLTSHVAAILLMLIVFVSVSYYFFLARPDEQAILAVQRSEFDAARSLWDQERPTAFRYVVDRSCDCPAEDGRAYLVTERNGAFSAVFPIPVESTAGVLITVPPRPDRIAELFDAAGRSLQSGTVIEVRYDMDYGFPEILVTGPDRAWEVRDFEVIE
jgi:hypothetical protein